MRWVIVFALLLCSCYTKKDIVGNWQGYRGYHFVSISFSEDGIYQEIMGVEKGGILSIEKTKTRLYKVSGKMVKENQGPYGIIYWIKSLKNDTLVLEKHGLQKNERGSFVVTVFSSDVLRKVP